MKNWGRVPTTDQEVMDALEADEEQLTIARQGLYRVRRQGGCSVIEALRDTLEDILRAQIGE